MTSATVVRSGTARSASASCSGVGSRWRLAAEHPDGADPERLGGADVGVEAVADVDGVLGRGAALAQRPLEELTARLLVADDRGDAPDVDVGREPVPGQRVDGRRLLVGDDREPDVAVQAAEHLERVRVDRALGVGPVGGQPAVQLVAVGLVAEQLGRQGAAEAAGLRGPAAVVDAVEVGRGRRADHPARRGSRRGRDGPRWRSCRRSRSARRRRRTPPRSCRGEAVTGPARGSRAARRCRRGRRTSRRPRRRAAPRRRPRRPSRGREHP